MKGAALKIKDQLYTGGKPKHESMLRSYGGLFVSHILDQEDLKPSKGEIEKVGLVSLGYLFRRKIFSDLNNGVKKCLFMQTFSQRDSHERAVLLASSLSLIFKDAPHCQWPDATLVCSKSLGPCYL